jgi:hypothetical protein
MPRHSLDPLGFNDRPNYMELVRAFVRLRFWVLESERNGVEPFKLAYEVGHTTQQMARTLGVSYDHFEDVAGRLFIGSLTGQGESEGGGTART